MISNHKNSILLNLKINHNIITYKSFDLILSKRGT
jgi:hypothetical protein